MIEGDSLLRKCFSDPKLDFENDFQLLHAVYLVEAFLQGLKQRKCNFHIVFFDNHEGLGRPSNSSKARLPRYLLARTVMIHHLRSNLARSHPSIRVHNVPSMRSQEFEAYLAAAQPYFVMAHDGADPSQLPKPGESRNALNGDTSIHENTQSQSSHDQRTALRSSILDFLSRGYSVALINGTDWVDTKVMSQVIERSSSVAAEGQHIQASAIQNNPMEPLQANGKSVSKDTIEQSQENVQVLAQKRPHTNGFDSRPVVLRSLAFLLKKDPSKRRHVYAFLMHCILIDHLPLYERRFQRVPDQSSDTVEASNFLDEFAVVARYQLSREIQSQSPDHDSDSVPVLYDLVDGRLFMAALTNSNETHNLILNKFSRSAQKLMEDFEEFCGWRDLSKDFPFRNKPPTAFPATKKTKSIHPPTNPILPFSNPVFDKHLASIHIKVGSEQVPYPKTARIFQEVSHWHNFKRLLDPKSTKPLDERAQKKALRRNQFFMAEMQAYAASLTNAAGKLLEPEVITATTVAEASRSTSKKEVRQQAQPKAPAKQKPGKSTGKAAVMENVAAKKAQMAEDSTKKAIQAWQILRKGYDSESSLPARYQKAVAYFKSLSTAPELVRIEVQLYQIQTLLQILKSLSKEGNSKGGDGSHRASMDGVYALLWTTAKNLSMLPLHQHIIDKMDGCLKTLELPNLHFSSTADPQKLSFEPNLSVPAEFAVRMGAKKFQMTLCGPYMDRNLDSAPDPRVPFEPDAWQRKVLDEIDADRSVFVVAPTSAGKTFISFRAMERVLRSSNDGILVYVAPTKALVNQIAAEIQARFKKTYKYPGVSVWAIHTRDYRINNPNGCQILVTVPAIFQIMLLAPSNANSWCNRLRFAIFDEVHCIGQAEDGIVWEQNILLCPCPVIALSATVGNPQEFYDWVSTIQKSYGHQSTMVVHQHRYSDLRKFMWTPPEDFVFKGLPTDSSFGTLGLDGLAGLTHIHPVACLGDDARGMPNDLSLEARDCYLLWQSMSKYQSEEFPVPASLDPGSESLPGIIRKKDVIVWEIGLKELLKCWMQSAHRSPFQKVVNDLQETQIGATTQQSQPATDSALKSSKTFSGEALLETTLPLLYKLHERNALPAIFFNYDRSKCVSIGLAVLKQLQGAEQKWKAESQTWQNTLKRWEIYKKTQEKAAAKKPAKVAKKKGKGDDEDRTTKADLVQDMANLDLDPMANFNPDAPQDAFSFAVNSKVDSVELNEYFRQLKWKGIDPDLMAALSRGIGIHHAGMNRKYRQV